MKLSECKHGVLVCRNYGSGSMIGMIVGISETKTEHGAFAIPLVQWQNGDTYPIHHTNIKLYED